MEKLFLVVLAALFVEFCQSEKCYSCSSPKLHLKWPKDDISNKLLYLQDFPLIANESCETVSGAMPVVDCKDSVCIKAVIKQPPAERVVCETGGAIVRDCWSRVLSNAMKNPQANRNMVRLAENGDTKETIGVIYTCEGFLCNSSNALTLSFCWLPYLIRVLL
ncbi:unnamed protein product [Caenorhabditis bovis]|uniref:DUF281 domain-containing protein n=1 Tax=Caenorhabditis bovis TaxID=2654633 RepID=A0A8S1E508_9PELO|nr:unnamed protein product [Caenorhabditis bovis]